MLASADATSKPCITTVTTTKMGTCATDGGGVRIRPTATPDPFIKANTQTFITRSEPSGWADSAQWRTPHCAPAALAGVEAALAGRKR